MSSASHDPSHEHVDEVLICVAGNCSPHERLYFKIRRTTRLRKLMEAYSNRCNLPLDSCHFSLLSGQPVLPDCTADNLHLQYGSKIQCDVKPDCAAGLKMLARRAMPTRENDNSKLVVENNGNFECIVCAHVYWPPVLCAAGHTLCSFCAQQLRIRNQPCPLRCKNMFPVEPPQNVEMRRVLERLKARCTSDACPWRGNLSEFLEQHEKRCHLIEVACPKSACSWTGLRGEVLHHLQTECGRVVKKCNQCNKLFYRDSWCGHLAEDEARLAADNSKDKEHDHKADWRDLNSKLLAAESRIQALEQSLVRSGLPEGGAGGEGEGDQQHCPDGVGGLDSLSPYGSGDDDAKSGLGQYLCDETRDWGEASALERMLAHAGLGENASRVCEELGLCVASDLAHVVAEDVMQLSWLRPVARRKLIALGDRVRRRRHRQQQQQHSVSSSTLQLIPACQHYTILHHLLPALADCSTYLREGAKLTKVTHEKLQALMCRNDDMQAARDSTSQLSDGIGERQMAAGDDASLASTACALGALSTSRNDAGSGHNDRTGTKRKRQGGACT